MGLRGKLAIGFMVPLAVTTLAIGLLETGHTTQSMVNNLSSLGNLLVHQTFEEMRATRPPNLQALRQDRPFRSFLNSVLAFGEAVVSVRVEDPNGVAVVAVPEALEGKRIPDVPSINQLQAEGGWWETLSMFLNLQSGSIYKSSGAVQINGQYAGTIKIELSTELIGARVRRSIMTGLYLIGVALALGSVAGTIMVSTVLRSVTALTAGIEQLAVARTPSDIKVESRDELGELADKFNLLTRRIMADRQQWEEERDRLTSAIRSINDAVLLLNAAGRVIFANAEALGRLGLPDGISMGKDLASLLGPDHSLVRLAGTAVSARTDLHNVRMDLNGNGSPQYLVSLIAMDFGGGNHGSMLLLRDVSCAEELEDTLNFSRVMARQGRLLSGIGHQLRNPLHAIGIQLELLADDARHGTPLEERIGGIRGELSRMTRTVGSLLRFIRLDRIEPMRFAVNGLVREIAVRHIAGKHRAEYQLDESIGEVEADRALLGEALSNIVANAVEAMPDGGTVSLRSELVAPGNVQIAIADQGGGIDPDHLDSIFDFCFTTKTGGAGIGLSMALRIIDLHHGTLQIGSRAGHGANVRITIPMKQAPAGFQTAAAPQGAAGTVHA
ncbi:MAG TPA: ATP-binding protein [Candidatus Binataceae bacterium]|nr:ATP-binding protein [Candidatus Binataceae bacterium]